MSINNLRGNKGYTILETSIAMALFIIVIFATTNILIYTSNISARIHVRYELQENARISMEFLTTHIREGQLISLKTNNNNTLDTIWIHTNTGTANEHITIFRYDVNSQRNWLLFGGSQTGSNQGVTQELARYISNIEMIMDKEKKLMYITITTDISIENTTVELISPIILNRTIDLRYKQIEQVGI